MTDEQKKERAERERQLEMRIRHITNDTTFDENENMRRRAIDFVLSLYKEEASK
jgi:hypothetical protein